MSHILEATDGRNVTVNPWNWGVLHHLVAQAGVLPAADWSPLRWNARGELTADQVSVLASFLQESVAAHLRAGERMFVDGTVTAAPDDGTLFRTERDMWKNYSLRYDVLERVIAFLRGAAGTVTVL
jgi:hypothetical protein